MQAAKSKTVQKMPVKLDFQVISCTGEDEKFRASELNYHGPTARGWRSPIDSTFPQEIVLQLKVFANLQQIQILSHQYLISEKIELFISSQPEQDTLSNNYRDFFEYLGFITFSDNKATRFHSRELKSILIPSKKAKYVKLRIHNNHTNDKNVFNQVALIAINIIGDEVEQKTEESEMNNNINFPTSNSYRANLLNNSNYISPYDDLAFHMSVDEETAKIIKVIESKMLQAMYCNRLQYVNTLEITLENLRAAGEILGIYEQEKKRAINLEDFDRAKQKKIQIDHFRQKIYNTLHIEQLLESYEYLGDYDLNDNIDEKSMHSHLSPSTVHHMSRQNLANGRTPGFNEDVNSSDSEKSPSRFLRPQRQKCCKSPQLFHSQSQTFSDSPKFRTAFTTSLSSPYLYKPPKVNSNYNIDASLEQVRTPSSLSDSLTENESVSSNSPEKLKHPNTVSWNGSSVPQMEPAKSNESRTPPGDWGRRNKIRSSIREQKMRSKSMTNNMVKSSFEAYEERMLPALRSYHGNEVVRECQLALDQQRKSKLNEREKKQAGLPISVFGIELIEKFYSKSFMDKEEGLKELQQELKNTVKLREENSEMKPSPPYNKMARAVIFLLHRGLRDTVYSVYSLAAETVRIFFTEFVPQRVSPSEVARSVEKLLPELLTKSGDVTPRIHNMAAHTLLSMAECQEVRQLNIIPTQLSRPLTSSVHPRLALSRLEMVEQLILNHGISKDKKSGLTCRTLAEFGSSGLHHPAEAVRKVSERILIHVYKINPKIVRKQLPPDDNVTRRNLLYRQLFQEFDVIDAQRKLSEQTTDNSPFALEKSNQILINSEIQNKSTTNHSEVRIRSSKLLPPTNYEQLPQKPLKKGAFEKSPVLKKLENNLSPAKKEKIQNSIGNGDILRFPSLTDSIKTTKTRMEQKKTTKDTTNSFLPKKNESFLINSLTKPKFPSGIPRPTNNKGYANSSESKEKPKNSAKSISKSKIPSRTIRIQMLDTLEKKSEIGDNTQKGIMICLNGNKEYNTEKSIKLSDSMLASIRENESAMNALDTRDRAEERLKTCIFCLSSEKWTTEDSLNKHYLKECLMLTTCEYCMEVTEISGLTNHLLDDCKWKYLFQKCKSCHQAILRDLYDKHECLGKVRKSRCPFCHTDVGDGESSWRKHLMGSNMCLHHPRQK